MTTATAGVAVAATDIAASLTMDEIPVKLRCAACNKLAVNAFRMPCCDQSICETCQASLPQACPVCFHEPVKPDDCKPNKALRTTIKVFLRKKGMEREAIRKKEKLEKLPATPTTSALAETPTNVLPQTTTTTFANDSEEASAIVDGAKNESRPPIDGAASSEQAEGQQPSAEAQMDIPRPSIESAKEDYQEAVANDDKEAVSTEESKPDREVVPPSTDSEKQQDRSQAQKDQTESVGGAGQPMLNNGFGFDAMTGFQNMGFNGSEDFSQMMQFMPNGLQGNPMGAFPSMMGMPGMGMDPMAMSQGMYGGFGGQGMDMNGMNMGMGFNAGHGAYGGYNGQAAGWNAGQDKYNPNAYGSHANGMGGDYGINAGYGGYNMPSHQGNFNQMHHQQYPNNDFQSGYNNQGFQNRGRGRGRGYYNSGRGRGGYNQVMQGSQTNYEPFHHQLPPQIAKQASTQQQAVAKNLEQSAAPSTEGDPVVANTDKADEEQMNEELNPGDEDDKPIVNVKQAESDVPGVVSTEPEGASTESNAPVESAEEKTEEEKPAPIETFISTNQPEPQDSSISSNASNPIISMAAGGPAVPLGPAALYSGEASHDPAARGKGAGRGFYRGAPEHRGGFRGRGSGFQANGNGVQPSIVQPLLNGVFPGVVPAEPKGLGVEGAPTGPKALREGLQNTGMRGGRGFSIVGRASAAVQSRPNGSARSRSVSPSHQRSESHSRSPSRHRSRHHRSHRHRSTSSSGASERERRKERHRRRSRKYEDEEMDGAPDVETERTRELSADPSLKKSSHRSHRDTDRDGRSSHHHRSQRERSKDRDGERRHRRKRSRSPVADQDGKEMEAAAPTSPTNSRRRDKDESRRRRDKDAEDRHRDRKRSRREISESPGASYRSSRRSKHERGEKETSRPMLEKEDKQTKPVHAEPENDHHTLEREARNRERLLKEMQRRSAMEGKGPSRRDSKLEGKGGGRRVSYKYEDEESDEARAARIESEREAGRWG